jgi:hypothetical protein
MITLPIDSIVEALSSEGDALVALVGEIKTPTMEPKVAVLAEMIHARHEHFAKEVSLAADRAGLKVLVKTFLLLTE